MLFGRVGGGCWGNSEEMHKHSPCTMGLLKWRTHWEWYPHLYLLFTLPLMVMVHASKSTIYEAQQAAVYPAPAFSVSHDYRITLTFVIRKICSLSICFSFPTWLFISVHLEDAIWNFHSPSLVTLLLCRHTVRSEHSRVLSQKMSTLIKTTFHFSSSLH